MWTLYHTFIDTKDSDCFSDITIRRYQTSDISSNFFSKKKINLQARLNSTLKKVSVGTRGDLSKVPCLKRFPWGLSRYWGLLL